MKKFALAAAVMSAVMVASASPRPTPYASFQGVHKANGLVLVNHADGSESIIITITFGDIPLPNDGKTWEYMGVTLETKNLAGVWVLSDFESAPEGNLTSGSWDHTFTMPNPPKDTQARFHMDFYYHDVNSVIQTISADIGPFELSHVGPY